jgi:hypothetical protein
MSTILRLPATRRTRRRSGRVDGRQGRSARGFADRLLAQERPISLLLAAEDTAAMRTRCDELVFRFEESSGTPHRPKRHLRSSPGGPKRRLHVLSLELAQNHLVSLLPRTDRLGMAV